MNSFHVCKVMLNVSTCNRKSYGRKTEDRHHAHAPTRTACPEICLHRRYASRRMSALKDYRQHAWETYSRAGHARLSPKKPGGVPTCAFCRRIHFDYLADGAFRDLAPVPEESAQAADRRPSRRAGHPAAGWRSRASLDPSWYARMCIFTDLRTAEEENPELVAAWLGELVRPEEGKFAALAGALAQNGVVLYVPKGVPGRTAAQQPAVGPGCGPGISFAHPGLGG